MDELEEFKENWNRDIDGLKKYSQKELFQMTKRKSVSIARWIFVVSIIEMLFWIGLNYVLSMTEDASEIESYGKVIDIIIDVLDVVLTLIPYVFVGILLYLNYKIKVEEEPKKLMSNILLMRKTVQYYVRFFLIQFVVIFTLGMMIANVEVILYDIKDNMDYMILLFTTILLVFFIFIITLFLRFIYHLIYGKLLYKLKENYEKLSKIEE